MCEFMSWISVGKKLYWFEDDIIEAKGMAFEDAIGHSVIEKYYGITGVHHESWQKVPMQIAKRINDGYMDKMARTYGVAGVRYNAKGNIKNEWWLNAQKFINSIKNVKWFDNHGKIKESWKVFDTYKDAESAIEPAAWLAAWSDAGLAAKSAARLTAGSAARLTAWSNAWSDAWSAAKLVTESVPWSITGSDAWSVSGSASELAASIVSENSIAIDFFSKIWEIWELG